MKAIATVVKGAASQQLYELDASQPTRIGRGNGCQIFLSDPLSSRTHAIISYEAGGWVISDADSRNGTLLNDKKITQSPLVCGDRVQIGSTELLFQLPEPDTRTPEGQTVVLEAPMSVEATGVTALNQLFSHKRSQDLLDLYQLSICLIRCKTPDEVASLGLDLLRVRTKSTVVGFMLVDDHGELRPQQISPIEMSDRLRLSPNLTESVSRNGLAVWVKDNVASGGRSADFADAICIPMLNQDAVLGAVHMYRDEGHYEQAHFDFAVSACNLLSVALQSTRAQASLTADHQRLVQRTGDFTELIGNCAGMLKLKDRITRVAHASGCVLVRGESGVGKELVSRAIHRLSPRNDRPLLCVNCAAIPAELMESQLFGHKKGAFTGADRDHSGWFQQAHTGTLFLDEVGEMTLDGQAKLLRILEGHPFMPVGSSQEVTVDVRVIAATNRDLRDYVREKKFREDLYYRLSVFELVVPPLRDRGDDIEMLMEHFLTHFRKQHGRPNLRLSPASRKLLREYAWPGNIRQLRNVIDSAIVLASGTMIEPGDLSLRDVGTDHLDSLRLDVWEERLIKEALKRTDNNIIDATKLLGVSRATLYRKLEQYTINRD